ncbi:syntaxin-17-like [Bolinopsis microptera]|uniref:syntaxin-17-like n=1 Tax=Bolinopsis microptera TaxID=2820187 RepID=UPI00307B098F
MPLDDGKVSIKSVQHTLNRFKTSLPQLCTQLEQHVEIIKSAKQQANIRALNREQRAASRTFKNLKNCLKELDKLENKVFYSDLDKFKSTADPLRQSAYDGIVKFVQLDDDLDKIDQSDLDTQSVSTLHISQLPSNQYEDHISQDVSNLPHSSQTGEEHPELMSLQETKSSEDDLEQLEATAQSWNQLQHDIQDVAEIMASLSKLVKTQGEEVDTLELNVEIAKERTTLGLLEIIKARRAKFAGVPVAGAVVGCVVGGPIGMLVGFKVAGVVTAALGTFVGYKSAKYLRRKVNERVEEEQVPGMLIAPTIGAYENEEECGYHGNQEEYLTDDSGEFQQFAESEIRFSEKYKK